MTTCRERRRHLSVQEERRFATKSLMFYRRLGRQENLSGQEVCENLWKGMGNWETSPVSEYPLQSICSLPAAQAFLQKLVRNLFAEGNDLFREKDFKLSLVQYVEGLNVADYAASDEVTIPKELLCKLHVNRAACYFAMVSAFSSHPQGPGRTSWLQCHAIGKDVKKGFSWFCLLPSPTLDETMTHTVISPLLHCVLQDQRKVVKERGPVLRYWECSSGPCWWGASTIWRLERSSASQYWLSVSLEYCSNIALESPAYSSEALEVNEKALMELSAHIWKRNLQYLGSKRLCASIFLRNLTAFLYGTAPEQVHPVHNEAESRVKN